MRRGLLPSRVRDVGIKYCSEGVPGEDLFSAFGVLPSLSGLSTHEYQHSRLSSEILVGRVHASKSAEDSGNSDSNDARFNLEEMDASSEGSLAENLVDFEAFGSSDDEEIPGNMENLDEVDQETDLREGITTHIKHPDAMRDKEWKSMTEQQGCHAAVDGASSVVAKSAPLCIKIDVEPTNRAIQGYSLMFNVENVAAGLRYGVEVKDHKTMLKVCASL
jgi:hypothetical protein